MGDNLEKIEHLKTIARPSGPGPLIDEMLETFELTQQQAADMAGISRPSLNALIRGRKPMTADMAHRLGTLFGINPGLLFRMQQSVDLWGHAACEETRICGDSDFETGSR